MHANVYTGVPDNTPFSSVLREEAIAVRGDRIQAVGKTLDIQKLKGPQTQVIDLGGHFVMPGFNDAHLHLDDAGMTKLSVDLTGVKSLDDLRAQVAKKVEESKAGDWILGSGWDETLWPVKVTPTRWDLDEVSGGHPGVPGANRRPHRRGQHARAAVGQHHPGQPRSAGRAN